MCGTFGREQVSDRLFQGLRRLEYRGYDSAGICTLVDGALTRRRADGELDNLGRMLAEEPLAGRVMRRLVSSGTRRPKQRLPAFM